MQRKIGNAKQYIHCRMNALINADITNQSREWTQMQVCGILCRLNAWIQYTHDPIFHDYKFGHNFQLE